VSDVRGGGSYGFDAPYLIFIPAAVVVGNAVQAIWLRSLWPFIGTWIVLLCMASGMYTSRRGKFVVWSALADGLALGGRERVLDLGCGRGAVLLIFARRLTTGRAVGVDIWRTQDQSGNAIEATRSNAAADRVADRVELHTADMSELPFERDSFDIVVSNIAIHNISDASHRERVIAEAVRVLRPGGRLLIADLRHIKRYADQLASLGMVNVTRRNLGWRMWWGGPWAPTRLVSAEKPAR
jgi:ubiquinone/menaquinone biosynthesis C-methylase UbiE